MHLKNPFEEKLKQGEFKSAIENAKDVEFEELPKKPKPKKKKIIKTPEKPPESESKKEQEQEPKVKKEIIIDGQDFKFLNTFKATNGTIFYKYERMNNPDDTRSFEYKDLIPYLFDENFIQNSREEMLKDLEDKGKLKQIYETVKKEYLENKKDKKARERYERASAEYVAGNVNERLSEILQESAVLESGLDSRGKRIAAKLEKSWQKISAWNLYDKGKAGEFIKNWDAQNKASKALKWSAKAVLKYGFSVKTGISLAIIGGGAIATGGLGALFASAKAGNVAAIGVITSRRAISGAFAGLGIFAGSELRASKKSQKKIEKIKKDLDTDQIKNQDLEKTIAEYQYSGDLNGIDLNNDEYFKKLVNKQTEILGAQIENTENKLHNASNYLLEQIKNTDNEIDSRYAKAGRGRVYRAGIATAVGGLIASGIAGKILKAGFGIAGDLKDNVADFTEQHQINIDAQDIKNILPDKIQNTIPDKITFADVKNEIQKIIPDSLKEKYNDSETIKKVMVFLTKDRAQDLENLKGINSYYEKMKNYIIENDSKISASDKNFPRSVPAEVGEKITPSIEMPETKWEQIPDEYKIEVGSGKGPTHAIYEQLKDNPKEYGLSDNPSDSELRLKAREIAIANDIIKVDENGNIISEIRSKGNEAYLLDKDAQGNILVSQHTPEGEFKAGVIDDSKTEYLEKDKTKFDYGKEKKVSPEIELDETTADKSNAEELEYIEHEQEIPQDNVITQLENNFNNADITGKKLSGWTPERVKVDAIKTLEGYLTQTDIKDLSGKLNQIDNTEILDRLVDSDNEALANIANEVKENLLTKGDPATRINNLLELKTPDENDLTKIKDIFKYTAEEKLTKAGDAKQIGAMFSQYITQSPGFFQEEFGNGAVTNADILSSWTKFISRANMCEMPTEFEQWQPFADNKGNIFNVLKHGKSGGGTEYWIDENGNGKADQIFNNAEHFKKALIPNTATEIPAGTSGTETIAGQEADKWAGNYKKLQEAGQMRLDAVEKIRNTKGALSKSFKAFNNLHPELAFKNPEEFANALKAVQDGVPEFPKLDLTEIDANKQSQLLEATKQMKEIEKNPQHKAFLKFLIERYG